MDLAAGPGDFEGVDAGGGAEAEGDGEFGLAQIAAGGHDLAGQSAAADAELDPSANRVAVAVGADEFEAEPVVPELLVVAQ